MGIRECDWMAGQAGTICLPAVMGLVRLAADTQRESGTEGDKGAEG